MELVAFLGEDKETWGQVNALINRGEWEKIIILKNYYKPLLLKSLDPNYIYYYMVKINLLLNGIDF